MLQSWEGNRRSGVTLAMRHRLCGLYRPRAQSPSVRDERPRQEMFEDPSIQSFLPRIFCCVCAATFGHFGHYNRSSLLSLNFCP